MLHNTHLLSVDLEDWFTSAYLRNYVLPDQCSWLIEEATYPILDIFDRLSLKATFFVLGSVAEAKPNLIREIDKRGHEIASHAYSHIPLWNLTPASFTQEVITTNNILEEITGKKVLGFRAPYASIDHRTSWAIDILEQQGFLYDSSIFPMKTILYGVNNAPKSIYNISSGDILHHSPTSQLIEVPFTVYDAKIARIPCTGGVYGRLLPLQVLSMLLSKVAKHRPINFYFHPWETYHSIPSVNAPLFNRFVSYYGNSSYIKKIECIASKFYFTTFKKYLNLE